MEILFLGYAVNPELADSLSGISIAGNKMQVNVLKGLESYEDVELKCITVYPVAAFPREKRAYIKGEEIEITSKITAYRVSFLNLPLVKQLWQTYSVYKAAKKIIHKDMLVFTFNLFPQVGLPAMWLKKKFGVKTCSLLADLPIDDNKDSKNPIRNFFRKVFDKATVKAINSCDGFIPLNEYAITKYAPGKPFRVVEGGFDISSIKKLDFEPKERKNIIYSGALTDYSGILNLIEAMKLVDFEDAVLEIYGKGYLAESIAEKARDSNNIKYMGSVTNKEMVKIQQKAFLLVNPRPVDDEIAMVTFPSKLFEYMTSGTPVLSTKLNGIKEEYFPFLFLSDNNSPEALVAGINKALSTDSSILTEMARGAYEFIVKEKNWDVQNSKIYHFLKEQTIE